MNFRTAWLRFYYSVKDSFDVLECPDDYDHSESALPPHVDCRFIHVNSRSGGLGNFRWVNSNPSSEGCVNTWGRIIWAGRWSLFVVPGRIPRSTRSKRLEELRAPRWGG